MNLKEQLTKASESDENFRVVMISKLHSMSNSLSHLGWAVLLLFLPFSCNQCTTCMNHEQHRTENICAEITGNMSEYRDCLDSEVTK